jgi:hypothetical protein
LSQSAIVVDLNRTTDRARAFSRAKDKVNEELKSKKQADGRAEMRVKEDQLTLSFVAEEIANTARQHGQRLQQKRSDQDRMLGEQRYPVKVDRARPANLRECYIMLKMGCSLQTILL